MNPFLIQQVLISDIVGLFSPKEKGPSGEQLSLQRQQTQLLKEQRERQKEQDAELKLAKDREKRKQTSRDRLLSASSGKRGLRQTLFQPTGSAGVKSTKLGV